MHSRDSSAVKTTLLGIITCTCWGTRFISVCLLLCIGGGRLRVCVGWEWRAGGRGVGALLGRSFLSAGVPSAAIRVRGDYGVTRYILSVN